MKFKKFFSIIAILCCTSSALPIKVYAKEEAKKTSEPYVNASYAAAIDGLSHRVLFDKNSGYITPMASTTKIITALAALNYGNLDEEVTISEKASGMHGSQVGYKKGEKVTIRELVYGLMLKSGNDAAIALAEARGGSVDGFLNIMNEYALEMGLTNTHFESPHGLDSINHYTTAYDLSVAASRAKKNHEFNKIVSTKEINRGEANFTRDYHNINKILWLIPEANGIKTGYTGNAGKCLVTSIRTPGEDMIVTVINSPTRWKETSKIYDYVKKNYEYEKLALTDTVVKDFTCKRKRYVLKTTENVILPVKKGSSITEKLLVPEGKVPPVNNKNYGLLQFYEDDKLIYSSQLKCVQQ